MFKDETEVAPADKLERVVSPATLSVDERVVAPADNPPSNEEVPPITNVPPENAPVDETLVPCNEPDITGPKRDKPPTTKEPVDAEPVVNNDEDVRVPETSNPLVKRVKVLNVEPPETSREPLTIDDTTSKVPLTFALVNEESGLIDRSLYLGMVYIISYYIIFTIYATLRI